MICQLQNPFNAFFNFLCTAEDVCYSTQLGQAATSNAGLALRVKYVEVYDCMFWVKQLSLLLLATQYERTLSVTLVFIYIQMPIFCLK